jgi:hypothetical protein
MQPTVCQSLVEGLHYSVFMSVSLGEEFFAEVPATLVYMLIVGSRALERLFPSNVFHTLGTTTDLTPPISTTPLVTY